jgi:hypothetical protein
MLKDENIKIDLNEVNKALQSLWDNNYKFNNFVIDFGVLDNGKTALVEMGEGYSMGAYDVDPKDYFKLVTNWFKEITK